MKTKVIEVHSEYPNLKDIAYCAKVIRQGGLVVFPTETVYGIAADFSNPNAMKRLREVKKRSDDKPFSVLVSQRELISNHTSSTSTVIYKLIDQFWPGPLTIIVPSKEEGQTIGLRMPANLVALKLVQEAQCTIAAPSANFEGNPPPTTCQEALRDLDGLVEVALDGGKANIGKSSTIVDVTSGKPVLQREGAISQKDLDAVAAKKTILFVCTGNSCRSVMAEYYLKSLVEGRRDVEVLSAGTGVFIQSKASSETVSILREIGMDATGHQSRPVGSILLKKSDLIFVMTRTHRDQVIERVPEVEKRVYLLREFANIPADFSGSLDIPDPIGQTHQAYKDCFAVIREAVQKVVELI